MRLFGVTQVRNSPSIEAVPRPYVQQEGHSVLMNVTHFDPYFYIPCPRGFASNDLESFKNYLNVRLYHHPHIVTLNRLCRKSQGVTMSYERSSSRNRVFGAIREIPPSILSGSLPSMRGIYQKFEISTLEPLRAPRPYLPTRVFERGQCSYQELFGAAVPTFESNIAYTLRFMIDTKVVGMNWIEVPAGNYTLVHAKRSKCQIEISTRYVSSRGPNPTCIQGRVDGTNSYRIHPKENGPRLHPSAS